MLSTAGRHGSTTGAHPHRGAAAEGGEHGGLVRAAVDEPERHLQGGPLERVIENPRFTVFPYQFGVFNHSS